MNGERDIGLFGPDSVTWKLHREPILLIGGLRSLYLQALHPRAVAGVVQNSDYRSDPWGRLARTSEYVGTIIYGSAADVEAAASRVRRLHARMSAIDPRSGERFRIDEPDLLRWVHIAEVESFLNTARRAGLKLTDDEVDRYYTEQVRAAELMGLDPATIPSTAVEVAAYFGRIASPGAVGGANCAAIPPELGLTRDSVETALFLTVPPVPQSWGSRPVRVGLTLGPTRWAYFGIAGTAFALLPPWARRMYGALGLPTTDVSADLSLRGMRLLLRGLIAAVPQRYKVAPMRQAALERAGLA